MMKEIIEAAQKGMEQIHASRTEISFPFYGKEITIAGFEFETAYTAGWDFGEAQQAMVILNGHELGKIDQKGQFEEGVLVSTPEDEFFKKKED